MAMLNNQRVLLIICREMLDESPAPGRPRSPVLAPAPITGAGRTADAEPGGGPCRA